MLLTRRSVGAFTGRAFPHHHAGTAHRNEARSGDGPPAVGADARSDAGDADRGGAGALCRSMAYSGLTRSVHQEDMKCSPERCGEARRPNAPPLPKLRGVTCSLSCRLHPGIAEMGTITASGLRMSGALPAATAPSGLAPGPRGSRPLPRTGGPRSRTERGRV